MDDRIDKVHAALDNIITELLSESVPGSGSLTFKLNPINGIDKETSELVPLVYVVLGYNSGQVRNKQQLFVVADYGFSKAEFQVAVQDYLKSLGLSEKPY
ncbi:MAG: hypothetical protein ABIC04_07675 [Nanoarchaeota archaeon]